MRINPLETLYALRFENDDYVFVFRQAPPADLIPKLLTFMDLAQAQTEAARQGAELVADTAQQWHIKCMDANVPMTIRVGDQDYVLGPNVMGVYNPPPRHWHLSAIGEATV